jgi:hypothetical protein
MYSLRVSQPPPPPPEGKILGAHLSSVAVTDLLKKTPCFSLE